MQTLRAQSYHWSTCSRLTAEAPPEDAFRLPSHGDLPKTLHLAASQSRSQLLHFPLLGQPRRAKRGIPCPIQLCSLIRTHKMEAGISIKPKTPINADL